jgi:hypothetical protein
VTQPRPVMKTRRKPKALSPRGEFNVAQPKTLRQAI